MDMMFQEIFNKLQGFLPREWDGLVYYVAYFEGSYSMKYFVKGSNGEYVDCYNSVDLASIQFTKLFIGLDKIIAPYRNEFVGDKKWCSMTMVIGSDGDLKADYGYDEVGFIEFEEKWKKKYLV
ncbi:MAG: immunity protein YezG family protein [Clostridium sp.]